jgi:hypothetical protein
MSEQMNAKAIDNASRAGGSASVSVPVIGAAEAGVWTKPARRQGGVFGALMGSGVV